MRVRTRNRLSSTLAVGGVTLAMGVTGPAMLAADTFGGAPPDALAAADTSRPGVPSAYTQALLEAWIADDSASMIDLAVPEVVQLLAARAPETGSVPGPPSLCEGAAGSTYCTWILVDDQLTPRVNNEMASAGAPHAVAEASFTTVPGAVAIWPLTTPEEAWNTQVQVDGGHSPWMLDPGAVVSSYATAALGFTEPVVEELAPTFSTYRVFDGATGVAADIQLSQPARADQSGIWTVAQVTSLPAAASSTPL